MNTIIWWLESPWQLRALVFALSFFACFVGPWLHSQSLLTNRLAARKPLEEKSETASALRAEAPVQQAEEKAKVPASQEQVSVQEKVPAPASAEEKKAEEHAHPQAESPVHAAPSPVREQAVAKATPAPVEAKAEVQKEQVPAPAQASVEAASAPVMQETAPTPAPVMPVPVEAKAPVQQEQAPAPAKAPIEQVPVPANQDEATVHEPASLAISKAQPNGGFTIVSQSTSVIPVLAGSAVEKQDLAASTDKGGSADVEVYVLSNKGLRRPNRVADVSNGELSAILDSDDFAKAAARFDTVACVGLGSRSMALSAQEIKRLIDNRAVQLCGVIAKKPYISANTKLYGLPLGQELDSAPSEKERSLIIVGIKNAKGDLADTSIQKKMVSEIIRGGKIANFQAGKYSEVASGNELRYIEVKNGGVIKNRPIKSFVVKPGYGPLHDAHRHSFAAHHKRCGDTAGSRTLSVSRKLSRSQASADASRSKMHHGCGIFDFPF
jgi:hypothetical protein